MLIVLLFFSCKNSTFDQNPHPDPQVSAVVWFPGSGAALKPMRIHNTGSPVNYFMDWTYPGVHPEVDDGVVADVGEGQQQEDGVQVGVQRPQIVYNTL